MLRWPRRAALWLTLAALTLLLVALAALQYRWTGEIGRADAERRQAQLERAARRFATGFDRVLAEALLAVHPGPGDGSAAQRERIPAALRTEDAALVARVLLVSVRPEGEPALETCTAGGCRSGAWPADLAPLRERLMAIVRSDAGSFRPGEILEQPLVVVMPVFGRDEAPRFARHEAPRGGPAFRLGIRPTTFACAELDLARLRERLLPQLAETHFGPLRENDLVVSVLRRKGRTVLYTSAPGSAAQEPQKGDLELPIPALRRQIMGEGPHEPPPGTLRREPGTPGTPARAPAIGEGSVRGRVLRGPLGLFRWREDGDGRGPADDAPFVLVVRHRTGSLERAVAAARRRNLGVGLGVLALLGGAAVVLAVAAQRARDLARQQLEFVASVTHELNTPLAAIRSAGQNLSDGIVADPAQVRRYGALIEQEGTRLTALVAQVLDFAGIESGARAYAAEPVSLARLVDDVLADLRLVLEQSGLAVTRDVPEDLPPLRGDAAALRRVLANLLTNAAKFAAGGGRLELRGRAAEDGRTVVLRVEDAGPGIPAAERERVFEPFYRGAAAQRNQAPGSGLGLSLVRRIVTAHGGRVCVEEAPGGGAAVLVALPAASAGAAG